MKVRLPSRLDSDLWFTLYANLRSGISPVVIEKTMKTLLALSAILAAPVSAVTVSVSVSVSVSATNFLNLAAGPGGDTLITTVAGQPLDRGRVHVGTFVAGFNPQAAVAAADTAALLGNFRAVIDGPVITPAEWSGLFGQEGVDFPGFYIADATTIVWPEEQLDQDIYLFIGNGQSLAESTELGLVRHFARISSSAPEGFELSNPLDDLSLPSHFTGGLVLNAHPFSNTFTGEIVMGSKGRHVLTDPYFHAYEGEIDTLQLVAIPEPGALIQIVTLGSLLALRRRR